MNEVTARDVRKVPVVKTFKLADVDASPAFNLPDEGTFAYHDIVHRKKADSSFKPTDALWRDSALGFRTAAGFIPAGREFADLDVALLNKVSWADVYLYREDSVDINKLTTKNYSEDDPNV